MFLTKVTNAAVAVLVEELELVVVLGAQVLQHPHAVPQCSQQQPRPRKQHVWPKVPS
jgi:hypothetical protein